MSGQQDKDQKTDGDHGVKTGPSGQLTTLYKPQGFFDKDKIISSTTSEVVKQWFLHPFTGVGPHSVSFSQSLTNRDVIFMYSQSGNYYYHSNCYNASYLTAVLTYYQITRKPKSLNSSKIDAGIGTGKGSDQEGELGEKSVHNLESELDGLRNVDPGVRIYYSQINHIPIPIWNELPESTRTILSNSSKHRLTIGGRLVQPREWKTMQAFDITKWGKQSGGKLNASTDGNGEVDLNDVYVWPLKTITGNPGTDYLVAPDFDPLPDKSGYYTKNPVPSLTFPEALNIKTKPEGNAIYTGNVDASNTVPVRSVVRSYSMLPCDIDSNRAIPTTNTYAQFLTKITKDLPDDAFRSMISRPAITDADARIWLAYNLSQLKYGSYMDVIPQVTAMLMLYSLTKDRHFVDSVVFRTIRNKSIKTWSQELSISHREVSEYPKLQAMTSHLTYFIKYMSRVVPTSTEFDPNVIDIDWIAVPVTSELLAVPTKLGAYVMCHLSSEYWNGTVTWHRTSVYKQTGNQVPSGTETSVKNRVGVEYFMPASNSVYIAGVKKVWLVVLPSVSDAQATIKMFGNEIQNSPDKNGNPIVKDITQAWADYWQGSDSTTIPLKITDFFWALTIMMRSSTTPDSTRRAVGLATELSNLAYPGVYVKVGDNNKPTLGGGAWTLGATKVFRNQYDSKDWANGDSMPKNADKERKKRIAGFSFSAVSPNIQHAGSYARLTQNLFLRYRDGNLEALDGDIWVVDRISQRWENTIPEFNVPQYVANQATSFSRLSVGIGLLVTGGGIEYSFLNSYAVQQFLTHNGAAMFGNVSAMLVANDIQPWFWLGYGYNDYPQFFDAYSAVFKQVFQSMVNPFNIHNLSISNGDDDWKRIIDYYSLDPNDQEVWMQHIPVPVCNYLQWVDKLEIPQSRNKDETMPVRLFGEELYGLKITPECNDLKTRLYLMVNDRKTAWPRIRVFDAYEEKPYYDGMWMDDYYYLSTALIDPGQIQLMKWDKGAALSSNTYARSIAPGVFGYAVETVMVITQGLGLSRNEELSIPHVTSVCLPDPPTAKSFLAQKITEPPGVSELPSDPVPTIEEVERVTESVTPVTSTQTQA